MSQDEKTGPASKRRRTRTAPARTGELWAKCPECRMPVLDAKLFSHLLKCPGAEVRRAEWQAKEAAPKPETKSPTSMTTQGDEATASAGIPVQGDEVMNPQATQQHPAAEEPSDSAPDPAAQGE